MADISTLVQDIYNLLEGKTLGDPEVLAKFGPELGRVLANRFKTKGEERQATLRLSSIGKPLRQLWYEMNGFKGEKLTGKTLLKFTYGDIIESLILVLAEACGHKVERFQEEVFVDGIKGHIDAVIDGVLVDVKSCSSRAFDKFKQKTLFTDDPFGYIGQLSGYAFAVSLPAAFLAVDKTDGSMCLMEVPQDVLSSYNIRQRVALVKETVVSKVIPEKCYEDKPDGKSGNMILAMPCSYCGYKLECWKDSNGGKGLQAYLYSNGPRFFTNISREPEVLKLDVNRNE